MEEIHFRCSVNLAVQYEFYALAYLPINIADTRLHGHPLIEFESQTIFFTGSVQPRDIHSRKIFDLNPLYLVCVMNNTNAGATTAEAVIEAHEYEAREDEPKPIIKPISTILDDMIIPKPPPVPKIIRGTPNSVKFLKDELTYARDTFLLFNPDNGDDRLKFIKTIHLLDNVPPQQDFSSWWLNFLRMMEGGSIYKWGTDAQIALVERMNGD